MHLWFFFLPVEKQLAFFLQALGFSGVHCLYDLRGREVQQAERRQETEQDRHDHAVDALARHLSPPSIAIAAPPPFRASARGTGPSPPSAKVTYVEAYMPRWPKECPDIFQVEFWRPGRTHPGAPPPRDVEIPTFASHLPFLARDTRRRMDAGTPGPPPSLSLTMCPPRTAATRASLSDGPSRP